MNVILETERLILREFDPNDDVDFYNMDSDPAVHKYLGNKPVKTIEEVRVTIQSVKQQYLENGIGRWVLIEKTSGEFIGWGGLKLVRTPVNSQINFYDVGYRLAQKHWNKGYATESAKASLKYGFEVMGLKEIFATAHVENTRSRKALEKTGLKYVETFVNQDLPLDWFRICS